MKETKSVKAARIIGCLYGIAGTCLVVAGFNVAGYWAWAFANTCLIVVASVRRDGWSVAMFSAYQAATLWGLWKG